MQPVLFDLFGTPIHTWGVAAALGFAAVAAVSMLRAQAVGISTNKVADLLFYSALVCLPFARLAYFATDPGALTSMSDFFNPRVGGASMYGAIIGILPAYLFLCHRYGLNPKTMADVFAPGLAIGLAIHRLGCLSAGCCYGAPCGWPWAIDIRGQTLHPTQLYEAIPLALLAGVLLWRWGQRVYPGQIAWIFVLIYGLLRIGIEVFRGNPERGFLVGDTVSVAQGASVVGMLLVWAWVHHKKDAPPSPQGGANR